MYKRGDTVTTPISRIHIIRTGTREMDSGGVISVVKMGDHRAELQTKTENISSNTDVSIYCSKVYCMHLPHCLSLIISCNMSCHVVQHYAILYWKEIMCLNREVHNVSSNYSLKFKST